MKSLLHPATALWYSVGSIESPMNDKPITLRLTLDVTYTPNGVTVDELRERLENVATGAVNEGLITGDSAAEVQTWSATATRL